VTNVVVTAEYPLYPLIINVAVIADYHLYYYVTIIAVIADYLLFCCVINTLIICICFPRAESRSFRKSTSHVGHHADFVQRVREGIENKNSRTRKSSNHTAIGCS
jgi:hypothetical protein